MGSGDAVNHEDGSVRFASGNKLDKQPGALIRRHPKAAPLITEETAVDYAETRRDKRREAMEAGFAVGIGQEIGQILGTDEAMSVFMSRLAKAGLDIERRDYARVAQIIIEYMQGAPAPGSKNGNAPRVEIGQAEIQMLVTSSEEYPWLKSMLSKK